MAHMSVQYRYTYLCVYIYIYIVYHVCIRIWYPPYTRTSHVHTALGSSPLLYEMQISNIFPHWENLASRWRPNKKYPLLSSCEGAFLISRVMSRPSLLLTIRYRTQACSRVFKSSHFYTCPGEPITCFDILAVPSCFCPWSSTKPLGCCILPIHAPLYSPGRIFSSASNVPKCFKFSPL